MCHTVCVTGASGFLGSHVTRICLERGWTVHATVRDLRKHGPRLQEIAGTANASNLKLFGDCDLMVAGSFDAAIAGCDTVIHTASPFFISSKEEDLVPPALEGTRNVLASVMNATPPVKQVVLTSSTAAIYAWYGCHDTSHVMTEADWSSEPDMLAACNWYCIGKTRAEKLAWEMSNDGENFKLAVMNPCLIFGPMLQPDVNTSSGNVLNFLSGTTKEIPNETKCIVDVRDVAEAHVLAIETNLGWGKRHLLASTCPHWSEIVDAIRCCAPERHKNNITTSLSNELKTATLGAAPPHVTPFDVSNAKALGVTFRGTEEMVQASVESLQSFGLL